MRHSILLCAGAVLLLPGCDYLGLSGDKSKAPVATQKAAAKTSITPVDGETGTPMAERIATLGFLNKRNNVSQDLTMKPGEERRIGNVVIRMEACERSAPWENVQQTGAFVKLLVFQRPAGSKTRETDEKWMRVFSGWLFKEMPSINVVEHPIYDVWVKECAMRFPGEEESDKPADESGKAAPAKSADSESDSESEGDTTPAAAPAAPAT